MRMEIFLEYGILDREAFGYERCLSCCPRILLDLKYKGNRGQGLKLKYDRFIQ
jgi:hypothetical protein